MNSRLILKPLETEEELRQLHAAAQADGHGVLFPTHLVQRSGELIGYASLLSMPVVNVWMARGKASALDSIQGLNILDSLARDRRQPNYLMCCTKESPYFPVMGKLGFKHLWTTDFHIRTEDK